MRALLIVASLSLILIAGCNQQPATAPDAGKSPVAAAPVIPPVPDDVPAIRGEISIEGQNELPGKLELRLRLLDMTDPSIAPPIVAERVQPAPPGLPYRYALPYEPSRIVSDHKYVVEASLLAGGALIYGTPDPVIVLTLGGTEQAKLPLARGSFSAADMAPADILKAEFEALEASIGGMERLTGERINADTTIGWDGFADQDGVRFARENVDYGDAGTASLRYGYRDGQPWVIAREQKGVETFLGWGPAGQVVLNRVGADQQLDEAQIEDLRSQAVRLYEIVSARVDRG